MKTNIIIICICLISSMAYAQQMPQYTQYLLNGYVINPAMAGSTDYFEGKINHREQWMGITDAPRTNIISVSGPLVPQKMGIGGYLFNDINGPTRQFGLNLSYSYHIKLTEDLKLSMALYGAFMQFAIDGSKISTTSTDPVLTAGLQTSLIPDAGFSAYGYSEKYFFGFSASQITHSKIKYKEISSQTTGRLVGHYFVMGGYNYDLNSDIRIQPSVLLKYVSPVPVQAEFSVRGIYKEMVSAALSYRSSDAMSFTASYTHQKQITLGYSYDFLVSGLQNYSNGSHEIMLSMRFKDRTKK
jgi:type IX secretion system PorP/SprF family membrane protein